MKIGGFMYWEQAYLCCQEAIKQEHYPASPPPRSYPPHTSGTFGELIVSLGEGRLEVGEGIHFHKVSH